MGSFFNSMGVVKEQELLARWTFDEGNGSVAADATGGGLDLLLEDNARWGLEENNTAISKHSLDIRNGDAHALALANDKIKATGSLPIFFGLRPTASQMHIPNCFPRERMDMHLILFKSNRMESI